LLSIMSSQGDAGQFRTPRHIIDFIVDVVNPTKDDKVLDPACGTGGFLVSSYKHILEQHDGKDDPKNKDLSAEASAKAEKPLTPDERKKLMTNFEGYDIDPTMVRIAQVNMYLHQFKNPKIFQYDSLSSEERWNDKFDVILANPPFMSPKGGIKPHSKFSIPSSRSEVLFVDYIMNHLRPKGRAGIIVPEGIIFQSGTAHKQLRKSLVEDGLYAVVSLPSGVFAPYSGVKTSILLFNNELAKTSQEILFVKIEQDGFDLGATKRPISKNDLPTALDILNKWNTGEKVENKLAVYVEKSKIAENGDYNLSGDRYRVATDYTNAKWPMVELKELCEITTGRKDVNEGNPDGEYPFFTCAKDNTFIDTFSFDTEALLIAGNGDVGAVKYYKGKFDAYQRTYVLSNFTNVNVKYLFQVLNNSLKENMQLQKLGNTMPYIKLGMLQTFLIPLPPLEIQEQIVAKLDGYTGIIAGAKQITQNWKPKIDIDPEWEKVKLGEIGKISMCKRIFKEQTTAEGDIPFYKIGTFGKVPDAFISREIFNDYKAKFSYPKKGEVLISTSGTIGRTVVFDGEPAYFQDSNIVWIENDEKKVYNKYLNLVFQDIDWITTKGGTIERLYNKLIEEQVISIPPLTIQKQIVEKIEAERTLVESAKKLIEIYDQNTKDAIAKLWSE
ncbi:N-6 DNA methylase, partial [Patescibacteria group bacterium]|nr:N-6 DNA methylase [Patescibacteria group bacterium]